MALVLADRVKETTTTTGTGTVTLAGAATGFQSFAAVGNANTTYYTIAAQTGTEWEVGIGTYTSAGTTLSRTTVLSSSNAGSLVTFSAGTKDVFVTYPSSRSIYADGTTLTATNSSILPATSGGTSYASYAVGDILFASTTTALSKLADVATGNAIISGGVGVAPSYGKIGLTTHVSGTLPIANGGTNSTATATAGGIAYGTGTAYAVTAAGTAGQVITSAGAGVPTWTTATNANTASAIVQRDASGNFTAGTITAALTGNATTATSATSATSATTATNLAGGAVGSIAYQSGVGATTFLADVATGNAVISGGVGIAPAYGKIGLTTHVSGVLPVANGGTNASTASITSFNNITGFTAAGATGTTSTNLVFSTSPTLITPILGTPQSGTLTSCTGLPISTGVSGLGTSVATALGVAVGSAGAVVVNGGALGTPSSGTLTNCTFPTLNQNTTGSAATFTSTTQNSQFNSIGVGTAASTVAGQIRATDSIVAFFSSDIRFKENVQTIPNALDTVNAIGGKLFDWTDDYVEKNGGADGYFIQKADFGVIAQDVQKVFPRATRTKQDGSLAVDYEKLSALAFAAINELTKRIEALEAKG
jgi:hypothetical protein